MPKLKETISLYRYFNVEKERFGTPFAMCAYHIRTYRTPGGCSRTKTAEVADQPCMRCNLEKPLTADERDQLKGLKKGLPE